MSVLGNLYGALSRATSQPVGEPDKREAALMAPDTEGRLLATTADGSTVVFSKDEWVAGDGRVWLSTVSMDGFGSGSRLQNPPVRIHIPVESMTAADNRWEKSERNARVPVDVTRYSRVVNPSNNPDHRVDLDVSYLEVHHEPF